MSGNPLSSDRATRVYRHLTHSLSVTYVDASVFVPGKTRSKMERQFSKMERELHSRFTVHRSQFAVPGSAVAIRGRILNCEL
jgi:hypothetical protein